MRRVFALAVLALVALVVSGCSRRAGIEPVAFEWSQELPPGSTLHVRDGAGSIALTSVPGTTLRVTASRSWRRGRQDDVQFQVTHTGDSNVVFVCAMWRASGRCGSSGYRGKQLDSFLSIFSLFHHTTDASASFVVEVPAGVAVDARTNEGNVSIVGLTSGVAARTVHGSVTARDVSGRLNLSTTNGDIRFTVASLEGVDTIRASTTTGAVHAELPPSAEGSFELSTSNGAIRSEFPIPGSSPGSSGQRKLHRLVGRIGNADRFVRLRTTTGSVALVKGAPAPTASVALEAPPAPGQPVTAKSPR